MPRRVSGRCCCALLLAELLIFITACIEQDVITREQEIWLQAVSRLNWARVLERLRTVCPDLESVAEFTVCCSDKLLSLCADPAVAMQTSICASEAEARNAALEQCNSMLNKVLEETYGELKE
jgi:hypothetical protein